MSQGLRFAIFFAVVLLVIGGVHYFLWARLVRDTGLPQPWRFRATAAIVGLALFMPAAMIASRLGPRWLAPLLAWPAFIWMGLMFLLFVGALCGYLFKLAVVAGAKLRGAPLDPDRRLFVARAVGAAVAATASAAGAWAVGSALRRPRIKELSIPIARLDPRADGMTIVQLTDIHVGPTIGREFMADLVARVNALEPDVIAITGDLVDGSVGELREGVAPLAELRARHGVYFVTGNHEYYSGAPAWCRHLESLGIRVLRNQRVVIGAAADGSGGFDLAGVDDWMAVGEGHRPDLPRALDGRDESRALVLLAHQPRAVDEASRFGVDLQLSGHTHGGQIWPFRYLVYLQQPYVLGLHRHGGTWLYVSPGTGYWGPPMRLATPAEITRVTLRAREA